MNKQPGKRTAAGPFDTLVAGVEQFTAAADEQAGREILLAAVKQYLSELPDDVFADLVAEVRPPATDPENDPKTGGPAHPDAWGFQPKPAK